MDNQRRFYNRPPTPALGGQFPLPPPVQATSAGHHDQRQLPQSRGPYDQRASSGGQHDWRPQSEGYHDQRISSGGGHDHRAQSGGYHEWRPRPQFAQIPTTSVGQHRLVPQHSQTPTHYSYTRPVNHQHQQSHFNNPPLGAAPSTPSFSHVAGSYQPPQPGHINSSYPLPPPPPVIRSSVIDHHNISDILHSQTSSHQPERRNTRDPRIRRKSKDYQTKQDPATSESILPAMRSIREAVDKVLGLEIRKDIYASTSNNISSSENIYQPAVEDDIPTDKPDHPSDVISHLRQVIIGAIIRGHECTRAALQADRNPTAPIQG